MPDPERLRQAYFTSTATLNFVRGLLHSGFASLHHPESWDLSFVKCDSTRDHYETMAHEISNALDFMAACGAREDPSMSQVELFTSHEGLVLDFEQAVTHEINGKFYNLGAHFLWIGDRTRQLDGAHIEYFRGIANPIGVKVGPSSKPEEVVALVRTLNPTNEAGRITLITRFGAKNVATMLPPVISAVAAAGLVVAWECDPMHGNTFTVESSGVKTRNFDDILQELLVTFDVHEAQKTWLGGVHFEMTGDNVTECTGGSTGLLEANLSECYESFCDPRLNYHQSLEMAFLIARKLKELYRRPGAGGNGLPPPSPMKK